MRVNIQLLESVVKKFPPEGEEKKKERLREKRVLNYGIHFLNSVFNVMASCHN